MPTATITPQAFARQALDKLRAQADPERARQVQKYFRETVRSFGIPSPAVRALAAEMYLAIKKDWHYEQALQLCAILFPKPELESKAIAALVLARHKKEFPAALCGQVKEWLAKNYLDNWASVDTFCPQALATLLARYPELLIGIEKWAREPNRWVRRASIVAFLKLVKREEYLGPAYAMAARHFASDDDLVQKAAGWLLREAGKRDMQRLEKFLLQHGPAIPRTTLRYAIERFPEGKRKRLLAATRKKTG